jgi:tetratricopeptide (TPR) repeat protein
VFSRNLSTLLFAMLLALVPWLAGEGQSSSSANPESKKAMASDSSEPGDPGVVLTRLADGATQIGPRPNIDGGLRNNDLFFTSDSYLLKIGDVYVKDKSIEILAKLLPGPVDSKLQITLIQGDHAITKELKRYPTSALTEKVRQSGPLLNMSDLVVGWHGSNKDYCRLGNTYCAAGNNFVAAPYFIAALKRPKFMMPSFYDEYTSALSDAMEFFYRTGMFDRFDDATQACLVMSEKSSDNTSGEEQEVLAKCAAILAKNNMPRQAQSIYGKLHQSLSHLSTQTQMRVLIGRASLLEQTEPAAALEDYKQLAVVCAEPLVNQRDNLPDGLQNLVSYGVRSKHWDLAESAQLQVVELQRKTSGWIKYSMYQRLVSALSRLSDIYELSGDRAKAQSALEEALSVYNKELNADQKILLERSFSLCPSEIELKLGKLYLQNGQSDKAKHEVDSAEKLVSDALGEHSAQSLQIRKIQDLFRSPAAGSQQLELPKAFEQVIESPGFDDRSDAVTAHSTDNIDNTEDARLARQAYDAAKGSAGKASSIIEVLLDRELLRTSHSADNVTRLINLIRYVETPTSHKKMSLMLERVITCLRDSPNALSTNRVFGETEFALLADSDTAGATASNAWVSLDSLLEEMRVGKFNRSIYSDRDGLHDLLCVSYVYAFLDEPAKALSILKHAESRYPGPLTRDISPIAYEAILYVMLGNMDESQKKIDLILAPVNGFRYDYSKMLIALSSALYQTGHTQLSLKLLDLDPNPAMQNTKKVLAYRRAIIYYELGKYSVALNELGGEDEFISLSGDQTVNYRLLRAQLLAKTGQTDKAILAMLKVGGHDSLQFLPLERAISLARTMTAIPTSTVEALVDAAQRANRPYPALDVEAVKYLCRIAREHDISTDKVENLERRLSQVEGTQNTTEIVASAKSRAESMESRHKPGASSEWASLARSYLSEKKYDEGTATMLHALQMPSGESFNHDMYHPGNLRGDLGFAMLLNAKQYSNAETILRQCVEMRKSAAYNKSASIEKSFLAELFIEQGKFAEAKKWAEELLATMTEKDGICPPKGGSMRGFLMFSTIDEFTEKKQFETAQQLLDATTRVLLSVVGPRNALFIEDYQTQAKLLEAQNKLDVAEGFARKALELEGWVGGSRNSGRISAGLLASILRKEGKNAEADRVSVTPEAKRSHGQDLVKLYNVDVDSSHMTMPERYADTAEEPLKALIDDAVASHGEGSDDTRKALNNLTRFYMQQGRNSEAEKVQLHELDMLDAQYGKCSEPKFGCFLYLAEIYLAENKRDRALKVAQAITQVPEDDNRMFDKTRSKLRWANVLLSLGKTARALEIAREVEKFLLEPQRRGYSGPTNFDPLKDCLRIMEQCGAAAETDADALRSKLNSIEESRRGIRRSTGSAVPVVPGNESE